MMVNDTAEETALLEQYECDMDKVINDNLVNEKEQINQRMFQLFQTSACAVAQMFKDKTTATQSNTPQSQLTAWQSFQNSAGAITVLYKDSLESCKIHYDLGITMGQQRKLKELLNWLKKKKRRTIRKDELISFLIGKQFGANSTTSMASSSTSTSVFSTSTNNFLTSTNAFQMQQPAAQSQAQPFPKQQAFTPRQQTQPAPQSQFLFNQQQPQANRNTFNSNLNPTSNIINGDTSSDLATFREALIMHNRSRDVPLAHSPSATHLQNYTNHHHHHYHNHHSHVQQQQQQQQSQQQQQQQQQQSQPACDDLDCFFCEQIATHIEHKRNASSMNNFDMESPTRKRSRFY
jgi:hypothetical protein